MQWEDVLPEGFLHGAPFLIAEAFQVVRHDQDLFGDVRGRMVILLVHDDVGGIATAVEAQITLKAAVCMFSVDVNEEIVAVRGNQIAIRALEPALSHVCWPLLVHVVVVGQVLRHHHTAV